MWKLRLRSVQLLQTKRRKTIRWYLVEGGGIQHFQIKLKFWHYTTNKFDLQTYRHKHIKLFIDIVMKRIYQFNIVAWNYRKKVGFPVCKKENFACFQVHRKRRKSARASPTPHHTLNEEWSARFTTQPLSALWLGACGPVGTPLYGLDGNRVWFLTSLRGTQREYSSKPLKRSILKCILVFKR